MRYVSLAAVFASLPFAHAIGEDAAKAESKKFQGTWQLVSAETDGKKLDKEKTMKIRVVIEGNKHTVYFGDQIVAKEIPFTLDPTRKPKEVTDTLSDGKKLEGIYELDGDTLKSCVAPVGKDRPKDFVAKVGTGHILRVFQRVKPSVK